MIEQAKPVRKTSDILKALDERAGVVPVNPTIVDVLTKHGVTTSTNQSIRLMIHAIFGGCRAMVFSSDMKGKAI